jgi:hypothetical protein
MIGESPSLVSAGWGFPLPEENRVKYRHDEHPPVLELSRRNLQALLDKLDDPLSSRTLITPGVPGEPFMLVMSVEDDQHYANRAPGEIYMPSTEEYR